MRLVLKSAAITVAAGVVVGVVLSLALNRVMAAWAGGSSRDPLILVTVSAVLLLVTTLACLIPARRAASIEPMKALRTE
jgi:ABC-type antimicrobial peptide transport system permease subunit